MSSLPAHLNIDGACAMMAFQDFLRETFMHRVPAFIYISWKSDLVRVDSVLKVRTYTSYEKALDDLSSYFKIGKSGSKTVSHTENEYFIKIPSLLIWYKNQALDRLVTFQGGTCIPNGQLHVTQYASNFCSLRDSLLDNREYMVDNVVRGVCVMVEIEEGVNVVYGFKGDGLAPKKVSPFNASRIESALSGNHLL